MTENQRPDDAAGQPDDASAESDATVPAESENRSGDSTENDGTPPPGKSKSRKTRPAGRGAMAIAAFALLVALGAAVAVAALGYLGQQRAAVLGERVATAERAVESNMQDVLLPRLRELESRVGDIASTVEQRGGAIARLQESVRETQGQITDLTRLVQGGRRHWQLLEIEDLMLAANRQLQLHRDPEGARHALQLVHRRLGKLNDPRLFEIREMVVDEIAALEVLPDPDIEGLAMSLSTLSERVNRLPLASDVPDGYATKMLESGRVALSDTSGWRHFVESLSSALDGMFTIRRSDGEYKPLLPPDQEFFLYQNLRLKIQTARLALLQREAEHYRDSLASARDWLKTFYDTDDPEVASAIEKLNQLARVRIEWEAPDIGGSLAALRAFLSQRGDAAGQPPSGSAGDDQDGGA